jgi:hypothetical protein
LDRACQKKDDFNNLFILSNHFVKRLLLIIVSILLVPIVKSFAASENGSCSLVDGLLDLFERRIELNFLTRQLDIDFKEGIKLAISSTF